MSNSVCDIISAISSAIGAISIPITILISLKPYKRKVSFQPTVFDVHFSEERDISHIDLKITNSGERKFVYQSWGVADKRKIQLYELDKNMLTYLSYYAIPYIVIATKCDKLPKSKLKPILTKLANGFGLPLANIYMSSSNNKQGKEAILDKFDQFIN